MKSSESAGSYVSKLAIERWRSMIEYLKSIPKDLILIMLGLIIGLIVGRCAKR